MPSYNHVAIMGNITREIELKYTPKGTAIAQFGIAINRQFSTADGEKREEVTFVDVEAYGKQAETVAQYCKKGQPLFVNGRLKLDVWDDKQTGQKRSKMKVIMEGFQFLAPPSGKSTEPEPGEQGPPDERTADDKALDAPPDDLPPF